eukprot:TRINITY_DN22304_c0_g1_i1.p1 TRINITY_DN22304_c0_g1~~TRINITY_DN22304_c0_g1_i1.p1  ORF type:complete len:811 (+),score=128.34 TRINITY_DN22304_c0_g1_i1:147-2435(+)
MTDVRTMSPQETSQWCNSLALCGVKGRILRELQEAIIKRQIDGLLFDKMLRTNTLTELGIEELNARLALAIRRSWSTDFSGVSFIDYAASQAHFQSRVSEEDPRRQRRDFLNLPGEQQFGGPDHRFPRGGGPGGPGPGAAQSRPATRDAQRAPPPHLGGGAFGRGDRGDHGLGPLQMGGGMRETREGWREDAYAMEPRGASPPFPGDGQRGYEHEVSYGMGNVLRDSFEGRGDARGDPHDGDGQQPLWARPRGPGPGPDPRELYGGYADQGYSEPGFQEQNGPPGRGGFPDRGNYGGRGPAPVQEGPKAQDWRSSGPPGRRPPSVGGWEGGGLEEALGSRRPAPTTFASEDDGLELRGGGGRPGRPGSSPGSMDHWGGGLEQALPKRAQAPTNVARMQAEQAAMSRPSMHGRGMEMQDARDFDAPPPAMSSKGGRANVRDPNASSEWGGLSLGDSLASRRPRTPERQADRQPQFDAMQAGPGGRRGDPFEFEDANGPGPSPGSQHRGQLFDDRFDEQPAGPGPGSTSGGWRGDLFDDGARVPPPHARQGNDRSSRGGAHMDRRSMGNSHGPCGGGFEGSHDSDADPPVMDCGPEVEEAPPPAQRPAPRSRRPAPPVDDGWGGQSLGDALVPKQATPSDGSTTGAGGSSSSRSGGQKSAPSAAGAADPGKSPEWIMTWVRSLPESHVPEKSREHLTDIIAEDRMDGRVFSDYVQRVPPEVCAPKHAMKLKAAWANVLKEAAATEVALANVANRPTQKATMIVV